MAYTLDTLPSKKTVKRVSQGTERRDGSFSKFVGATPKQSSAGSQPKAINIVIPTPGVANDDKPELPPVRVDQNSISLKSNSSTEKKCHVYVHHYSKIPKSPSGCAQNLWWEGSEIHQNMYKHEFSEYYDAKIQTLKKQFDNLNLRKLHTNSTNNRFPKTHPQYIIRDVIDNPERAKPSTKAASAKSSVISKVNKDILFKPEYKAAIDKLEETYWAKWKPNKQQPFTAPLPKAKGLYTENEKVKSAHQSAKSGRKERGDSNQTLAVVPVSPTKSEPAADHPATYTTEPAPADPELTETNFSEVKVAVETQDEAADAENEEHAVKEGEISAAHDSESEDSPAKLKHTDSFILTSKKQSEDKPHYQQPTCIKLFKNNGYSTNTTINYIKGGSYPLKSCLRNSSLVKPSHLGRPGSPIRGTMRSRQGKISRYPS